MCFQTRKIVLLSLLLATVSAEDATAAIPVNKPPQYPINENQLSNIQITVTAIPSAPAPAPAVKYTSAPTFVQQQDQVIQYAAIFPAPNQFAETQPQLAAPLHFGPFRLQLSEAPVQYSTLPTRNQFPIPIVQFNQGASPVQITAKVAPLPQFQYGSKQLQMATQEVAPIQFKEAANPFQIIVKESGNSAPVEAAPVPVQYAAAQPVLYRSSLPIQYAHALPVQYAQAQPVQHSHAQPLEYPHEQPVQHEKTQHLQYPTAQPDHYAPSQPIEYAPTQHITGAPTKPVQYIPAQPSQYDSVQPVQFAPVQPVAYSPVLKKVKKMDDYDSNPEYEYGYDIEDTQTGDSKSQSEQRQGNFVRGSYSVVDPDGHRRTVEYTADPVHGFSAVVRREPINAKVKKVAVPVSKVSVSGAYA
ncbi:unnamed protein product [Psylliodes chrysocephalus]|uniref:Cuticle protein n=1 Tax=Psylliodes chrysocephalus TaxID=3402493 RepID=A0A9P0D524_9CUCU|nr:unnamed protein product [Psylliodes chrysocephala]